MRCILEHPEDLGVTPRGFPASIWQPEVGMREAFGDTPSISVAGHQCQFPGVDRSKPTRLYSDILTLADFGRVGWPTLDTRGNYLGPLPRHCGHRHREKMIGRTKEGGFNTSPTAAYPDGMCQFLAVRIINDFLQSAPTFGGVSVAHRRAQTSQGGRIPLQRHSSRTWTRTTAGAPSDQQSATSRETDGIRVDTEGFSEEERRRVEADIDEVGAYGLIKDGLTHIAKELLSSDDDGEQKTTQAEDVAEALTSDEERELPGQTRPKRGAGWWGSGRPMRTHRKGLAGDLVDGSGLPSPGRWKVSDRNLPDDEVARELREVLRASLHGMETSMCGGTLRSALLDIMAGKLTASPLSLIHI